MPRSIASLASSFLHDPAWVEVTPNVKTVDQIEQRVMFVARADKRRLLAELLHSPEVERVLVFTRTKHGANRLVKQLDRAGIRGAAIHGNKSQSARRKALEGFRNGDNPILVATDLAARGIDVEGISHVFNFDLPNEPETYVHRIGRTGRAGLSGIAISFCDETEGDYLRDIEKLTGQTIPVVRDHAYEFPQAEPPPLRLSRGQQSSRRRPSPAPRPAPRPRRPPRARGPQRSPSPVAQGAANPAPAAGGAPPSDAEPRPRRRRRRRPRRRPVQSD